MPSASTKPSSMRRTSLNPRTSRRRRGAPARSRNRLEVSLCSATGPAALLSCPDRACFFFSYLSIVRIEESAGHRVARSRDITPGEHDLEEAGVAARGAEHFRAAVQVDAPDAAEALVEALRVEGADALPVAVEALGPMVERDRVMPAQVLDVEHLQAGLLHLAHRVGEARDPAAGEHVLADEVIGLV